MPDAGPVSALHAALLIAGGFGAGFVNVVAGAGSALTLPVLMLSGLDVHAANGTNRVAVLAQVVSGTTAFHRQGVRPWRATVAVMPPAVLGGVVGALSAAHLPATALHVGFGALFVALAALLAARPGWMQPTPAAERAAVPAPLGTAALFFAVGVYGGLFQAGVGIPLLLVIVRALGLDLAQSNAAKTLLTGAFTLVALAVFGATGQIDLPRGALLALGTVGGAWLGARAASRIGAEALRRVIIAALLVAAARSAWVVAAPP